MARKNKSSSPTWTTIRSRLREMEATDLIALIKAVVDSTPDAKLAVVAELGLLNDELREPYRAEIDKEFKGRFGIGDWNFGRCLKAVTAYEKAAKDPAGTLDLLLHTLERGADVANIASQDEKFHDGLYRVIERAGQCCNDNPEVAQAEAERIRAVVDDLEDVGYGIGDTVWQLEEVLDDDQ